MSVSAYRTRIVVSPTVGQPVRVRPRDVAALDEPEPYVVRLRLREGPALTLSQLGALRTQLLEQFSRARGEDLTSALLLAGVGRPESFDGALKPGGTLVVVDHSAADGSGTTLSDSLHRIDKAAVVAALTKAGFKLEAETDLYKHPDDPRTANVFDPAIRGKTDQFTLRFRKPR